MKQKKDQPREEDIKKPKSKKQYSAPMLTRYGDIRTRTLAQTNQLAIESGVYGPNRDRI